MTTYDDGTPVQPGDYVRAEFYNREGDRLPIALEGPVTGRTGLGVLNFSLDYATSIRRIDRPTKPRPPLPTQLGAVVWVGPHPFFLGHCGWYSGSGSGPLDMSFAERDWTTTPPEAS